jgi:tRNA A37 threonylcarbamoyladenosine synthetase subunit TsaC/SUA5/YrdC
LRILSDGLILIQTDTTVGFLSKSSELLREKKRRPAGKEFLKVTSSLKSLKNIARVPLKFRRELRYSRKTSYVFPNGQSCRLVNFGEHRDFLKERGVFFSTSANISGDKFQREIAENLSDFICEDWRGLKETQPSQIFKLGRKREKRLR